MRWGVKISPQREELFSPPRHQGTKDHKGDDGFSQRTQRAQRVVHHEDTKCTKTHESVMRNFEGVGRFTDYADCVVL